MRSLAVTGLKTISSVSRPSVDLKNARRRSSVTLAMTFSVNDGANAVSDRLVELINHTLDRAFMARSVEARVPFLHFFDGFRTSHEVNKIELLDDEVIREMIDEATIRGPRTPRYQYKEPAWVSNYLVKRAVRGLGGTKWPDADSAGTMEEDLFTRTTQ